MSHWADGRIRILVTRADIVDGEPMRCEVCPIALAARRAFPEAENVQVLHDRLLVMLPDEWKQYWLPREARAFVGTFDNVSMHHLGAEYLPRPFAFELP